jgi:hypothetical protein
LVHAAAEKAGANLSLGGITMNQHYNARRRTLVATAVAGLFAVAPVRRPLPTSASR